MEINLIEDERPLQDQGNHAWPTEDATVTGVADLKSHLLEFFAFLVPGRGLESLFTPTLCFYMDHKL